MDSFTTFNKLKFMPADLRHSAQSQITHLVGCIVYITMILFWGRSYGDLEHNVRKNSSLHFKWIGVAILIMYSLSGYDDVISEPMI
jgi:hypothetical protein